jgi:hypothetical protein
MNSTCPKTAEHETELSHKVENLTWSSQILKSAFYIDRTDRFVSRSRSACHTLILVAHKAKERVIKDFYQKAEIGSIKSSLYYCLLQRYFSTSHISEWIIMVKPNCSYPENSTLIPTSLVKKLHHLHLIFFQSLSSQRVSLLEMIMLKYMHLKI